MKTQILTLLLIGSLCYSCSQAPIATDKPKRTIPAEEIDNCFTINNESCDSYNSAFIFYDEEAMTLESFADNNTQCMTFFVDELNSIDDYTLQDSFEYDKNRIDLWVTPDIEYGKTYDLMKPIAHVAEISCTIRNSKLKNNYVVACAIDTNKLGCSSGFYENNFPILRNCAACNVTIYKGEEPFEIALMINVETLDNEIINFSYNGQLTPCSYLFDRL